MLYRAIEICLEYGVHYINYMNVFENSGCLTMAFLGLAAI